MNIYTIYGGWRPSKKTSKSLFWWFNRQRKGALAQPIESPRKLTCDSIGLHSLVRTQRPLNSMVFIRVITGRINLGDANLISGSVSGAGL